MLGKCTGKVIEKLEFIENGQCFQLCLSLFSSDIELNFFFDISQCKYQPSTC